MPWRTVALPAGASLYDAAQAIVASFDFDFDHAFGFYDNLKLWGKPREGYELFADMGEKGEFPGTKKAPIGQVFDRRGKRMLMLFDYGDQWPFVVELVETRPGESGEKLPRMMQSEGEAPLQYGDEEDDWDEDSEESWEDEEDEDEGENPDDTRPRR
ncbi:MAG: hypothetical protein C4524_13590 [Candidatus Zixiibacteriota bacterium]|nr:MAG: hypothetical protein C4524_13590 [candidate division Zixibacteria bacterium]